MVDVTLYTFILLPHNKISPLAYSFNLLRGVSVETHPTVKLGARPA